MKIPTYQPVSKEDVPKAADWIDELRQPDVEQIRKLTQALQGKLDSTNGNCEVKTVNVSHGVRAELKLTKINGKASGALIIASGYPTWNPIVEPVGGGLIRVTVYFREIIPAVAVPVTFLILGDMP